MKRFLVVVCVLVTISFCIPAKGDYIKQATFTGRVRYYLAYTDPTFPINYPVLAINPGDSVAGSIDLTSEITHISFPYSTNIMWGSNVDIFVNEYNFKMRNCLIELLTESEISLVNDTDGYTGMPDQPWGNLYSNIHLSASTLQTGKLIAHTWVSWPTPNGPPWPIRGEYLEIEIDPVISIPESHSILILVLGAFALVKTRR